MSLSLPFLMPSEQVEPGGPGGGSGTGAQAPRVAPRLRYFFLAFLLTILVCPW
jgi:hypothetical protein